MDQTQEKVHEVHLPGPHLHYHGLEQRHPFLPQREILHLFPVML